MNRSSILVAALTLVIVAGCTTTRKPITATSLEPKIREKVGKGLVEPGFTPEMVYLALGKPSEPAQAIADATKNGTWIYNDFHRNDRDFVQAGFRRRVVLDPTGNKEVVVTERIDPNSLASFQPHSVHVTFRDGRVVEVQHVAEL